MRDITYDQQTINSSNPLACYAHRTRMRLALAFLADRCPTSGTVVEFGAGPGHFLPPSGGAIGPQTDRLRPIQGARVPGGEVRRIMIETGSVDVLAGFEVCQHMYPDELDSLLVDATRT